MKDIYTQKQLRKLCKKWQKILRLQDWKINLEVVHYRQINEEDQGSASVVPSLLTKTATIRIADPSTKDKGTYDEDYEDDMLDCLVHELIHLHLESVKPTRDHQETDFELAIVCISEALVGLYRKSKKGNNK